MNQLITPNNQDEVVNMPNNQDEVVDINLEGSRRKRFRIDKDNNRILELDTTYLSIIDRFQKKYQELIDLVDNAFKNVSVDAMQNEDGEMNTEYVDSVIGSITDVNIKMRGIIDQIFNSNVSEVCAPYGSMLDPINGKFRFEHIFDTLIPLYENDIDAEMKRMNARVQKHTSKYVK